MLAGDEVKPESGGETIRKYRIMVADVPAGAQTINKVLGDAFRLLNVFSMDGVNGFLTEKIDLIICGIHFDDSRMFDLLRLVKANPASREIPFLCFRDLNSALAPALIQSLEIASRALGAVGFVDLYDLKSRYGIRNADERFRDVIFDSLGSRKSL